MFDMIRRLVWFAIAGSLITFSVLLIVGNVVERQAAASTRPVVLRDEFTNGVHNISGIVPVPTSCASLSVRSEPLTQSMHRLLFETWIDSAVQCVAEETPRWVKLVVFTDNIPVRFVATLDGKPYPIAIFPYSARHEDKAVQTKPGAAAKTRSGS